jgi:hypothetical protein
MQRRSSFSVAVLAAVLLLSGTGCGSGKPKIYKVTGKVTLDGQPLAGAFLQFMPADPATGLEMATGTSGGDGVYNLTTYNTNDGAMEGDYKVLVTRKVKSADTPAGNGAMDPKAMQNMFEKRTKESFQGKNKPPAKNETEIHKDYSNFDSTPLKARVTSGANAFDFPLKKGGGT